jgi:isoquinoline 1-oxidoreductase subunit beta
LQAHIDAQGVVNSLRIQSAGDAISPRWFERAATALSSPVEMAEKTTAEGLFDLPYSFANQKISHVATRKFVPVGYWRSVGHSHNAFFSECYMDELAMEAGQDPLAFRRSLLKDMPRYRAVLDLAASKAGWGTPLPAGQARGIALHASFGSIAAQVAVVSIEGGLPRVHRVVCAIDCGTVVNPGIVAQQMEGSVVFALSAALFGRIDIQKNFPQYGMLKLAQSPQVDTYIVSSQAPLGGVGEPGAPPLAPAVANALYVLTGKRQRALPFAV